MSAWSIQAAVVESVRVWPAPDHTRLVFDLSGEKQDLDELMATAHRHRMGVHVALALRYARDWFGTPIPAAVESGLPVARLRRVWFESIGWSGP